MALNLQSNVVLRTGRIMPIMGLGTWQLKRDTSGTVEDALKLGYRMIDTSGDYGTQPGIGEAVKRSGIDRSILYITTKVEETDADAYEATRKNLQELGMEYADLVLIHRPPPSGAGVELWLGLMRAKEDGLVKDIGVSNYPIETIEDLVAITGEMPVVNQIEWSPFGHSDEMLEFAYENDMVIQAYSPLTHGKRLEERKLTAIADRYGKSSAQLLIRWNIQRGTVPIPKANQLRHLEENIDVFDFHIDSRDMAELKSLNEVYSSLGSLPYM